MAVLGIESTAHTLGIGIVTTADDSSRCHVLANQRDMVRPDEGIIPREAAAHHAEIGPDLLQAALDEANLTLGDLHGIAFSQGPGLGPCLRVGATMARSLAHRHKLPLLGVNHCVAHLEIGRGLTDAQDPVLLYASGANTQVIAHARGRYRVFGETLDIGIGNGLDKFARDNGIPFPGGPEIERLAKQADQDSLLDMPYTVKGMDMVFAGLATRARQLVAKGVDLPTICHAIQEHAFAALCEVTERALAHTQKDEVVLGGGVACNQRLQDMARAMAEDRGATFYCPPRPVLVDNGAMIAWNGLLRLAAGEHTQIPDSAVDAHWRTDQVAATWRTDSNRPPVNQRNGAEAIITDKQHMGRDAVTKQRIARRYRHPTLDERIRRERTRDEANLLMTARRAAVPCPTVLDLDRSASTITLRRIEGTTLREALADAPDDTALAWMKRWGHLIGRLHDAGVTHGDLTTSNVLVEDGDLVIIDFGLGQATREVEPRAVDLHLVEEALTATDPRAAQLLASFLGGYQQERGDPADVMSRLDEVRSRGRYR